MVTFETERLIVRPWTLSQGDREVFHTIMSDAQVRAFYVTRMSRAQSDETLARLVAAFPEDGLAWQAVCLKSDKRPIAFAGLAHVAYDLPFTPCVEVGWQFLPQHWGQGYASEAARGFLRRGFEHHGLGEIVAFAVHNNHPSIAVMQRIGMTRDPSGDFNHPSVPEDFSHLNPHVLYRINAPD